MRGWLHAAMGPGVVVSGTFLLVHAAGAAGKASCAVFVGTAVLLFGCSAVYHLGSWGPRGMAVLRRIDHSNIALIIAGTYTPLAVMTMTGGQRVVLLAGVWAGALGAIGVRLAWIDAPRWSYVPIYIGLGWVAMWFLPTFWRQAGPAVVWLLLGGGIAYTVGAVVYALKRPDPWPRWFGFHEIFHVGTVAGFTCHFVAVWMVATP
jgi:hemolysin III